MFNKFGTVATAALIGGTKAQSGYSSAVNSRNTVTSLDNVPLNYETIQQQVVGPQSNPYQPSTGNYVNVEPTSHYEPAASYYANVEPSTYYDAAAPANNYINPQGQYQQSQYQSQAQGQNPQYNHYDQALEYLHLTDPEYTYHDYQYPQYVHHQTPQYVQHEYSTPQDTIPIADGLAVSDRIEVNELPRHEQSSIPTSHAYNDVLQTTVEGHLRDNYELKVRSWNPHTVQEAYGVLNQDMKTALKAAYYGFGPNLFQLGKTVPTYSMPRDPLATNCLAKYEEYIGFGCQRGQERYPDDWSKYVKAFKEASATPGKCQHDWDFDYSTNEDVLRDMSMVCSSTGMTVYAYPPGSNCDIKRRYIAFDADWTSQNDYCKDVSLPNGLQLSVKLVRNTVNDAAAVHYLQHAFHVQEWLKHREHSSLSDQCLIKDIKTFVDSECEVPATADDKSIEIGVDTANLMAMHATGRCGVVGHLYPLSAPFGNVGCNQTHFVAAQYYDWECRHPVQLKNAQIAYQWGQCVLFPRVLGTTGAYRFVRMYPTKLPPDEVQKVQKVTYLNQNNADPKEVEKDDPYQNQTVMWLLISGLIVMALAIFGLACAAYQLQQKQIRGDPRDSGSAAQPMNMQRPANILDATGKDLNQQEEEE